MQNRRKRRLQSCGIPGAETNLRMIAGMHHSNKRPAPVNPRSMEEARVQQRTISTEAYENNEIVRPIVRTGQPLLMINLPNHPSPHPFYHNLPTSRETHPVSPITHNPPPLNIPMTSEFDFSPPPSPAPVTHKSSVFTFDLPQSFGEELRPGLTSATPANLLDEAPAIPPPSQAPNSIVRDPLFEYQHSERYSHRSQSAFTR